MRLPGRKNPDAIDLLAGADYLFYKKKGLDYEGFDQIDQKNVTFSSWLLYRFYLLIEQITNRKVPSESLFQAGMAVLEALVFAAKAPRIIKKLCRPSRSNTQDLDPTS